MKLIAIVLILMGLINTSECSASIIWTKNPETKRKFVSFTFDDGPNGIATLEVLEILRKHNIKATFFVIGKNVERYPMVAKQIVKDGHIIGSHSYGHEGMLAFMSKKKIRASLEKNNKIIHDVTGVSPSYFRPPNSITSRNIKEICDELNMKVIGVNVFINDPIIFNANTIVKKCLKAAKKSNGGIIVLHDGFSTWSMPARKVIAEALDRLIPLLEQEGYEFIKLDQI